jgi:hypothetical protein
VKIRLSPSALKLYSDCPRCFWLDKVKKIKRPAGIFPSLPGGIDRMCKTYFDKYRCKPDLVGTLPPELQGHFEGTLYGNDPITYAILNKWRDYKKCDLKYTDEKTGAVLTGALDDCLLTKDGLYVPLDYKSRSSAPKEDTTEFNLPQVNTYSLILTASGFKSAPYGFLLYYWPIEMTEGGIIEFTWELQRIETSPEQIVPLFEEAIACLLNEKEPEAKIGCEYCEHLNINSANKTQELPL